MPVKSLDRNLEIQVTLLTQEVRDFIATQRDINTEQKKINEINEKNWFEATKILERLDAKLDGEVELMNEKMGNIKERISILNSIQVVLSGAIATWLGFKK